MNNPSLSSPASPDVADHEVLHEVPGDEVDGPQTSHRHLDCLQGAEAGVSARKKFNQPQIFREENLK